MTRALLGALVAAAALAAASGAAAAAPYRLLGEGTVETDGERYALFHEDGQPLKVIDDATGRTYELAAPRAGCVARGVSEGFALWDCDSGAEGSPPLLMNVQTGATAPPPGWDAFMRWWRASSHSRPLTVGPPFPAVRRFGRHWIETTWSCYHCEPELQYLNWRSGALVPDPPFSRVRLADLDDRDLEVPLCAPLLRRVDPAAKDDTVYTSDYLLPYDYQPPWGLPTLRPSLAGKRVELDHCGQRRRVSVSRCRTGPCEDAQLGAGYLTWSQGSRVYSYFPARRKRRTLPTTSGLGTGVAAVQHTRRTIYVEVGGSVYATPSRR